MSYGQEGARSAVNVKENFPLYDTISIRADIPAGSNEGFSSFAALAQQNVVPFFTMRNRSEFGTAITNKDTKDALAYQYDIFSIGVEFFAPFGIAEETKAGTPPAYTDLQNAIQALPYMFDDVLRRHTAFILRVREDDKLVTVADLIPSGYGVFGGWNAPGNVPILGHSQGWPALDNRYSYKTPIKVPRNCVIKVDMEIDNWGRKLIAAFPMFREWYLGPFAPETGVGTKFESAAHIRVTLMGQREVQQRGELHY